MCLRSIFNIKLFCTQLVVKKNKIIYFLTICFIFLILKICLRFTYKIVTIKKNNNFKII